MTKIHNVTFEEWENERMRDPEFRAACEAAEAEYQAASLRIKVREILHAVDRYHGDEDFTDLSLFVCIGSILGMNEVTPKDMEWAQKTAKELELDKCTTTDDDVDEDFIYTCHRCGERMFEATKDLHKCDPLELDK